MGNASDLNVATMGTAVGTASLLGSSIHHQHKSSIRRESRVRVGVRIRPLTSQEIQQSGKPSLNVEGCGPSIRMGQKRFTYDAVFDSHRSQNDLYDSVSNPLLSSFVDGYNATIMAYGQTGSGKTFTMGSEAHTEPEESSQTGLIPRFIADFFLRLQKKKEASDKGSVGERGQVLLDYSLKASFLEVYGEDVFDLLDSNRKSLPLREDSEGGIVVVGLTSRPITSTAEALQVLHEGTMNRTTAATLMNLTSSRSHAVFTISLTQITRSHNTDKMDVTTRSCFTFVDLAGSERMKKTGAEGERAREGIKINEGLLALGNVINALADEERLAKEKKIHVPYRQSKLTRLLQDALGGNSQTLFLACVSPSDTNASETLSTLNYANRARNICNTPTKNIDATVAELQRLHAVNRVLQFELVKSRFTPSDPSMESNSPIGKIDESLLKRDDVEAYIQEIYKAASEMISPGKAPFPSLSSNTFSIRTQTMTEQISNGSRELSSAAHTNEGNFQDTRSEKFDHSILGEINPDEEMAILDHLLELQQQDHDYESAKKQDDEKLKDMNGELEKEEAMLLQLRESLKVYHGLKKRYEELMTEVQQLETEKSDLARQLERATADPTVGCSAAIKMKLEKVEMNLTRARRETLCHREKYRAAEDQARKCKVLERKVSELKHAKISLIKNQKEAAARYKEFTEAKTKELSSFRRKEKIADRKMSKLENELRLHKRTLSKRKKYCTKLSDKLKQTEAHLVKLLALRKRDLTARNATLDIGSTREIGGRYSKPTNNIAMNSRQSSHSMSKRDTKAANYIFDRMVLDKVKQIRLRKKYKDLVAVYSETMRNVVSEVKKLEELRKESDSHEDPDVSVTSASSTIRDLEENVADLELRLELIDSDLQDILAQLPGDVNSSEREIDEAVTKLMGEMSTDDMSSLLVNTFSKFVEAETDRQSLKEEADRKDSALRSFEMEVDSLNHKVKSLSKNLAEQVKLSGVEGLHRMSINHVSEDKYQIETKLKDVKLALEKSEASNREMQALLTTSQTKASIALEDAAVAKAIVANAGENIEAQNTLRELQNVWEELGLDSAHREFCRRQIERSLEDTCTRLLEEAVTMRKEAQKEVNLLSYQLKAMRAALGILAKEESPLNEFGLLRKAENLKNQVNAFENQYLHACSKREKLLKEAKELISVLCLTKGEIEADLNVLLESENLNSDQVVPMQESLEMKEIERMRSFVPLPANALNLSFLASCEAHVRTLRVRKSVSLVRHRELQQVIADKVSEMHMGYLEAVALVESWIMRKEKKLPEWWSSELTTSILHDSAQNKYISLPNDLMSRHLEIISKSLTNSADSRRSMSDALKSVVEHAQRTLLDIVGREFDASEAYAGFHDALFRLPALSKDFIISCISEMEALLDGIESMTQSEIEALTVVWEALKISSTERRNFWGMIEDSNVESRIQIFSQSVQSSLLNGEEWMNRAVEKAIEVHQHLDKRLDKLSSIHLEVERLRSKQDSKSKILSLDSEIRIMNAKLIDFEELQCNKQRLLSKKNGGAGLLKEERFRKQMQSKFVSNLKQLANLLKLWEKQEKMPFDASLLSDDVRKLMKNPDQMENWVEERTKFMGLRTIKTQTPTKRPFGAVMRSLDDSVDTVSVPQTLEPSPHHGKRITSSVISMKHPPKEVGRKRRAESQRTATKENNGNNAGNVHDKSNKIHGDRDTTKLQLRPSKRIRRTENVSILPFGSILADTSSPINDSKLEGHD